MGLAALALAGAAPAKAAVGAFAYDEATGKYGASWNEPDRKGGRGGRSQGLRLGQVQDRLSHEGRQCGAIAATDNGKIWGGAWRSKREDAEKAATANCEKRPGASGKCKVKTAECNK